MKNSSYLLVDASSLPEVYGKVLQAKQLLANREASSTSEAVRMVGISRSVFYKYKDAVFPYNKKQSSQILTIQAVLLDRPGVLMSLMAVFYDVGANILTINQNIPVDGRALIFSFSTNGSHGNARGGFAGKTKERGRRSLYSKYSRRMSACCKEEMSMMKIAILGHGTVGSGVAEVLTSHAESIARRAKEEIEIKYILDIRDFPDSPLHDRFVKDFQVILNDPEVAIVAEVMGGLHPAFDFVKACLENGKSVVTSNKELVAAKGAELLSMPKRKTSISCLKPVWVAVFPLFVPSASAWRLMKCWKLPVFSMVPRTLF